MNRARPDEETSCRPATTFLRRRNFRDLGGILTRGGLVVGAQRLFRSSSPSSFDPDERLALLALGLRRAIDLRTTRAAMQRGDGEQDVPYGENWHDADDVTAWAEAADKKRPWRTQFRDTIAERVAELGAGARLLELGSGPGFLAERVLERCPNLEAYTLLDFSELMLELSRERLRRFSSVSFVRADFRDRSWIDKAGGPFDCVTSMQAVHEARHKRRAPLLYEQIHHTMRAPGLLLVCDHTPLDDSARSSAALHDGRGTNASDEDSRIRGCHRRALHQ